MKLIAHWLVWITLSLGWVATGAASGPIQKFVFIIPVYREFYNQNIGAVLESLAKQDLDGLPFRKIDVVFVVNNTTNVDEDIRLENQETVQFLRDLADNKPIRVHPNHNILKAVSRMPISQKLNIQVMDFTTPGRPHRNIGQIRDIGLKQVLASLEANQKERVLIAQLDADSVIRPQYIQNTVHAFEYSDLKFALMTMYYGDQPDSEERVYQRKITTDVRSAAYIFRAVVGDDFPGGGGPRIVATAQVLEEVGGVPHETLGEDVALIRNLRIKFPTRGRVLDNDVFAKYRARDDGYDAQIYKSRLGDPVEFSAYDMNTIADLPETLKLFERDPILHSLYQEALQNQMREHRLAVTRLRSLTAVLISDLQDGSLSMKPGLNYPALIANTWFQSMILHLIQQHDHDADKVMTSLTEKFPYYFSDPPLNISQDIARLRAATQVLLHRPFLKDPIQRSAYLSLIQKSFPQTTSRFLDEDLKALTARLESHKEFTAEELRGLMKAKSSPQFEQFRSKLEKAITKYLDNATHASDFGDVKYEELKDLILFAKYPAQIPLLQKMQQAALERWTGVFESARQTHQKNANGLWQCPGCKGFHLHEPPAYSSDSGRPPNVQYIEYMIGIAQDTGRSWSRDPELRRIFHPLFEKYRQTVDLGIPNMFKKEDLEKFQKLKESFAPARVCRLAHWR